MAEVLSFRDQKIMDSDPAIGIIRSAVIQFFDELIVGYEKDPITVAEFSNMIRAFKGFLNGNNDYFYEEFEVDHFNTFPDIEDIVIFLTQNGFENANQMRERFGEIENLLFFECLTNGRCFASMRFLTDYFEKNHQDRFDIYPYVIKGNLKAFANHAVIVLKDRISGWWYLSNPSNILDTVKMPNGDDFQRAIHTLRAESYNSLVKLTEEIDGGIWPSTEMEFINISSVEY